MSPNTDLDKWDLKRYSRHLLLSEVGVEGQCKLKSSAVLVIGAGGLGSPVLAYLAAAGVGRIGIVDFDAVEESNLQRQIIHNSSRIGQLKVESARAQVLAINPRCTVDVHATALTSTNALDIVADYDIVIDGTDNFPTRYLANDAAVISGKPYIYGSIFKFEGQVSVFNHADGPNYRDLYPEPPPPGLVPSCAEGGVLGVLPGVIGCIQATEAIKIILGLGSSLSGRLLLYNALEMEFRELKLSADPAAPPITALIDYRQFCGYTESTSDDPLPYEQMSVRQVSAELSRGWTPYVLDVRRPEEAAIAQLPFADTQIPLNELPKHLDTLPTDQDILVHCKLGGRSAEAAVLLKASGFKRVVNMNGGIDAWSAEIDTEIARY